MTFDDAIAASGLNTKIATYGQPVPTQDNPARRPMTKEAADAIIQAIKLESLRLRLEGASRTDTGGHGQSRTDTNRHTAINQITSQACGGHGQSPTDTNRHGKADSGARRGVSARLGSLAEGEGGGVPSVELLAFTCWCESGWDLYSRPNVNGHPEGLIIWNADRQTYTSMDVGPMQLSAIWVFRAAFVEEYSCAGLDFLKAMIF
jgi:hypothetical protein